MIGRLVRRFASVLRVGSRTRDRTDESVGESDDQSDEGAAESEDGEGGSVWDLIPSWQYTGLHAESGGLARDEQESALRDIQERADWIEDQTGRTDDPRDR